LNLLKCAVMLQKTKTRIYYFIALECLSTSIKFSHTMKLLVAQELMDLYKRLSPTLLELQELMIHTITKTTKLWMMNFVA